MKRIRPRFLIVAFWLLSLFFIFGIIVFWKSATVFRVVQGTLLAIIIPYVVITTKIEYYDDFCYLFGGRRKIKIDYMDVVKISSSGMLGGYVLQSYDTRERNFFLFFPFERKKMRDFFDTIKTANPEVAVYVGWYRKLPRKIEIKNALKFILFGLAVFAVDYLIDFFSKK